MVEPHHAHKAIISKVCHDNYNAVSPGLAFADPALHLGLFVVELIVGIVSPPGCRCYHCSGLASGVVSRIFCKARQTEGRSEV